jgi:hypothetical protein
VFSPSLSDIERRSHDKQNWTQPIEINNYKRTVPYKNMEIPVLELEYEYKAYKDLGRDDKAKKILEFIKGN